MKRLIAAISIVCVMMCWSGFASAHEKIMLKLPDISATSAVVMEAGSGRVIYAKNPEAKMPMASTTKIMTALVAIERGNLDDIVTVSDNAFGEPGSSIFLGRGEKVILRDLLYGLMLQSGNDAAVAIAEHIGGSVEGFAALMNEKAAEIGAKNTHFMNPHGLHDPQHYTTAYDLALITSYAMHNPVFAQIVSTKYMRIPWEGREYNRVLKNKNKILWQYEGGNGVKTGYTDDAGKCLVSAAKRNGMQLVCVVLKCPGMFPDSMSLLDYCFANYQLKQIVEENKYLGFVSVKNGLKNGFHVYADKPFEYPLAANETVDLKVELPPTINAPVLQGKTVGKMQVWLGNNLIYSTDIYAAEDILENSLGYHLLQLLREWI